MAEAKMHNGKAIVAYRDGHAIDSDGNVIEGAPKQAKDTDPAKQPGSVSAPTPEERMGAAIAAALQGKTKAHDADDDGEPDESDSLPSLDDMPAHLESISDVDQLKALKRKDKRKGGKELIQERIDALKGE